MGDNNQSFSGNDIRNVGHEGINLISQTAHSFLNELLGTNDTRNANTRSGTIKSKAVYYLDSNEKYLIYYIFMPGVSKEHSNIQIKNGKLIVTGNTNFENITDISYERVLSLPFEINSEEITASSKDGVYLVNIPKKQQNIDIQIN